MRLYIGVIRRHQKPAGAPVVTAVKPGGRQQSDHRCRLQDQTKMQPPTGNRLHLGASARFEKKDWRFVGGQIL